MKTRWIPLLALLISAQVLADDFAREGKRTFKDTLENKPAPALQVTGWLNTPDANAVLLADLKGKVLLIDFWGTW
ncbi:MAG: hypothetical protein ACI9TH_004870 [Kiritimatiellia bacterium]|jgi:hypothetical protein